MHQFRAQAQVHDLLINPAIYAELSLAFETVNALDEAIESVELRLQELPRPALIPAGRALVKYRRQCGTRTNVLPDFFIGAHAAVLSCGTLTRDSRRYRNYSPRIALVSPGQDPTAMQISKEHPTMCKAEPTECASGTPVALFRLAGNDCAAHYPAQCAPCPLCANPAS